MKRKYLGIIAATLTALVIISLAVFFSSAEDSGKWIVAWGTGTTEIGIGGYEDIGVIVTNVTCRSVIVPTASGSKLRLKFSNVYGQSDLRIEHVTVAKSVYNEADKEYGSKIVGSSLKDVTFGGKKRFTVPAGQEIVSDPVDYKVTALEPVSVSMYVLTPGEIRCAGFSGGHSYLTTGLGDLSDNETFGLASVKMSYGLISVVPAISSMDVYSSNENAYSVVVIGDSTVSNNFPLRLAEKLCGMGYDHIGVAGKGIIGNSLLSDGIGIGSCIYGNSLINRFDTDALSQSGVKYVIVKIGCNDIVHPKSGDNEERYGAVQPTAEELEAGLKMLADRCHEAGIKIIMAYLGPWNGYTRDFFGTGPKYTFSIDDWNIACNVNEWIRTTDVFDKVIDFNTCSTSPDDPTTILAKYTKDGAHPNEELQKLWSDIFPVEYVGAIPVVNRIELDSAVVRLPVGEYVDIDETVFPQNAVDKSVVWSSYDQSVASVDGFGVVEAKKPGLTLITCKSATRDVKAGCIVAVCSISFSKNTLSLYTGQKTVLTPVCLPSQLNTGSLTWSSSDSGVAAVASDGTVTAKKAGKCTVSCVRNDTGSRADCVITVTKKIAVKSVSLNYKEKTVVIGKYITLKPSFSPADASDKSVSFTSSDTSVATVSSSGKVTAKKEGTCKITCKSSDSGKTAVCVVTVKKPSPSSVKLNKTTLTVNGKSSATLKATVYPSNAGNKSVKWSSSNEKVATVSSKGVVKGVAPGKCTVTCTTVSGKKKVQCTVTIKKVAISSVTLSKKDVELLPGNKTTLKSTVSPSNTTGKIKWSSSNKKVATVSSKGVVTAVKAGTAVITCSSSDGKKSARCTVRVPGVPVFGVKLNKTGLKMQKGATYKLKASVLPSDAENKSVKWKSSDPKIATVSSSGKVTALKKGKAVITVKTVEGACTATCTVTVS